MDKQSQMSFYATKVIVDTDDSVSSRVTVIGYDPSDVISEMGVQTALEAMDISDIEAFLKQYMEDQREDMERP